MKDKKTKDEAYDLVIKEEKEKLRKKPKASIKITPDVDNGIKTLF
jgi:hypothetical protein